MLILSVKKNGRTILTTQTGERIVLVNRERQTVSLGIEAPASVKVLRESVERRDAA